MDNSHRFFRNTACRYFPCHPGADPETFNCLFCFCPLYFLPDCGGSPEDRQGVKDCTACLRPHRPEGYDAILDRLRQEAACRRAVADKEEEASGGRGGSFPPDPLDGQEG